MGKAREPKSEHGMDGWRVRRTMTSITPLGGTGELIGSQSGDLKFV